MLLPPPAGDNHEDLALCELRGEQARGHIGVWGAFAMLNHSCAPNAINYVVDDAICVRAARSEFQALCVVCSNSVVVAHM